MKGSAGRVWPGGEVARVRAGVEAAAAAGEELDRVRVRVGPALGLVWASASVQVLVCRDKVQRAGMAIDRGEHLRPYP